VLLVIDTERDGPELRHERVPGQPDPYPHIYGPLNLDAVIETRPFTGPGRRGGSRAGAGEGSPPPFPGTPCG
jgi:uncharacterized protein (DUF952 family)